jgi:hypothetical protein
LLSNFCEDKDRRGKPPKAAEDPIFQRAIGITGADDSTTIVIVIIFFHNLGRSLRSRIVHLWRIKSRVFVVPSVVKSRL